MNLQQLIEGMNLDMRQGSGQTPISDLVDDSRQASQGCAFIARAGSQADGRSFILDAIAQGAVAVIGNFADTLKRPEHLPRHVAVVSCPASVNIDQSLAGQLAARFFDHPAGKLQLLAVTGTNGKTTTACLCQSLLNHAGVRTGLIGTVFIDDGERGSDGAALQPAQLTTPGVIDVHRILGRMVNSGCQAGVIEVSSHALDQRRTAGIRFTAAIFTNLTGDHLDYHGSMDRYAGAKASLFASLDKVGWAILNGDDAYSSQMVQACCGRIMWTTLSEDFQPDREDQRVCRATVVEMNTAHSRVQLDGPWGSVEVKLPLVGRHNVANALQAAAAANIIHALDRKTLRNAIETCPAVPGRLEPVQLTSANSNTDVPQHPIVLVDYAHTHDALENVLQAMKPLCRGRLIVLFGCGGDRDKTKRPRMAQVASRLADIVFITSDNPRSEQPEAIIRDILAGLSRSSDVVSYSSSRDDQPLAMAFEQHQVFVDADRARAIGRCIMSAKAEDTILLAGKGHEDYQIIGNQKRHFDDRQHATAALKHWMQERRSSCNPQPLI